jgi:hypothetical protein
MTTPPLTVNPTLFDRQFGILASAEFSTRSSMLNGMCRVAQILLNHGTMGGSSRETPIAEIACQGEQHAI